MFWFIIQITEHFENWVLEVFGGVSFLLVWLHSHKQERISTWGLLDGVECFGLDWLSSGRVGMVVRVRSGAKIPFEILILQERLNLPRL